MTILDLKNELEVAKNISLKAGDEILKIYNTDFEVEYKSDNSPLTLADKRSNEMIVKELEDKFPDYAVLSEEFEDNKVRLKNDWCWIIDPLDGTKEFLKKNDEFTVNIALAFKKRPVLGIVYLPVSGELYYASKGNGAYYEYEGKKINIHVDERIKDLRLVKSRSHASESLQRLIDNNKDMISEIKSSGSSIKGCLVARGEADIYYRYNPTMEWDTAAMHCIVEEAGGIFLQMDGTEMLYNRENTINDKGFYILNKIENKLNIEGK